jgi:ribosome-binding protein 1/Meckel syndrome type 1 protein
MDLIALRFEARHLEVEGKLEEALDICRDILRHHAHETPSEQIFPVFIQASEISVKLGDREGAASLLLGAAERYADAGRARAVIDLYQRLRRLGPGRKGLDLEFARRMLEQRHPTAAREFLTDLARRQKKEKLLATLERMAGWPDAKVQVTLLDFLDKAQGLRVSAAGAQPAAAAPAPSAPSVAGGPSSSDGVTEVRPAVRAPEAPGTARTATRSDEITEARPAARVAAPRSSAPAAARDEHSPPAAAASAAEVMDADAVVFVTPERMEPEPHAGPRGPSGPTRSAIRARPRRRSRSRAGWGVMAVAGVVVLAVGAVFLAPRLRRAEPGPIVRAGPDLAPASRATSPASDLPATAAQAESLAVGAPADEDSVPPMPVPVDVAPATPIRREQPPTVRPSLPAPITTPAPRPRGEAPDTARQQAAPPAVPEQPVVTPPAPAPSAVDYVVVVVEGLQILDITREGEGAVQRIVVRQLLESGDTLDLRESDLGQASASVGAGRLLVRPHPSGGAIGTARVGRFLVNARAPVAPEILEPLLMRLVERVP